jgi:hypothetical protein
MSEITLAEILNVMRRTGHFDEIQKAREILPDPVVLERDRHLLESLGLTPGGLTEDMGGSP